MFLESFRITGFAVAQMFLLGALGYFLYKKNILGDAGLDALSRLTIEVTLPCLMFSSIIADFDFRMYPNWWAFPLLSIAITLFGLAAGSLFTGFIKGAQERIQFLSLVSFQNSGYLPLVLLAALLPAEKLGGMFIYLFLFLLGFNLVIFSFGVYLLVFSHEKKFSLAGIFSPPVVATLLGLAVVLAGAGRFFPVFVTKPLKLVGDCTLPLAMCVVGGNIAQIHLGRIDRKAMFLMALVKLVLMPAVGLMLVLWLKLPELIGLLIVLELAVPSATFLSVFVRQYRKEDLLISQGVFFGHLLSLVTIPVFLSLYFSLVMLK